MVQSSFGAGNLWGIPQGANPTPVRFATIQDVTVDFSFDFKMLYGGAQFALEQARGKGKADIKATIGRIDPALFNATFFGGTIATGEVLNSVDETSAIPGTPWTVTVTNSATWATDLGVYDSTAAKYLKRVASGPTTGQYSVTAGAYLFAAADTTHTVRISYTYGSASTGQTITYTNQLLGSGVIFGVELVESFSAATGGKKSMSLYFPAVQASKLSMPLKLDDFTLPTFDMSAQDDGSGNVFTWSMTG